MARMSARPLTQTMPVIFAALILCLSFVHTVKATSSHPPPIDLIDSPEVQALEVFPRRTLPRSHQRREDPVLLHSDSFRLTLSVFNETFHLHLRPNDELVHPAARINHWQNGVLVSTEPLLRENVLAYHGDVVSEEDAPRRFAEDVAGGLRVGSGAQTIGWARILMQPSDDGPLFEGAVTVRGTALTVATVENYLRNARLGDPPPPPGARMVIYAAGAGTAPTSCAHDSLPWNMDPARNRVPHMPSSPFSPWWDPIDAFGHPSPNFSARPLSRRDDISGSAGGDNFIGSIGQTAGCPKSQKVIYMGVAADCAYVRNYGGKTNATTAILNDWNSATGLYKSTFNVSLGIVQLNVQDVGCPAQADPANPWNVDCSADVTLNDRLSLFSAWRGTRSGDGVGLWHLMSGCPTGTEVGVAWLGTLCVDTASGQSPNVTSGTAVSTAGPTEWEVVTHEIGHNFGAIHDCTTPCTTTDPCCPFTTTTCSASDQFIMNPTSSSSEKTFSPCSIGNICSRLSAGLNTSCLADPGAPNAPQTIALQMCGNGIVEAGEECDPGAGETSPCCNATTCKFHAGAVCDPASSPCCTQQCGFASSSTVCRPALDARCDIAETCDGQSAACPADVTKPNGMTCAKIGSDTLTCASGMCTSVSQQCQMTGASLNLTTACSQQSGTGCSLSCADPTDSSRCLVLQAVLPNGLGCGYGGTCSNGVCQPGSLLDTAKAWYLQNLQLAIPITVVAGVVALLLSYSLAKFIMRKCCLRKPNAQLLAETAPVTHSRGPSGSRARRPMSQSQEGLLVRRSLMGDPRLPPIAALYARGGGGSGGGGRAVDVRREETAYPANPSQPSSYESAILRGRNDPFAAPPRQTRAARESVGRGGGWVDDTLYNGPRR